MQEKTGKYLTFFLGNESYGIPIKKVKEIIGMLEITHIPKTKTYLKGVVNLRGKIIPVTDLRLKFGLIERAYNERTCIIIIEVDISETRRLVGLIVDTVAEVVNIQAGEIEASPEFTTSSETDFLEGIGKLKERVILILDIEKILSTEEIALFNKDLAV